MALDPRMISNIEEVENAVKSALCEQLRQTVERLRRKHEGKPTWPLIKTFILATFGSMLEECGIRV